MYIQFWVFDLPSFADEERHSFPDKAAPDHWVTYVLVCILSGMLETLDDFMLIMYFCMYYLYCYCPLSFVAVGISK